LVPQLTSKEPVKTRASRIADIYFIKIKILII